MSQNFPTVACACSHNIFGPSVLIFWSSATATTMEKILKKRNRIKSKIEAVKTVILNVDSVTRADQAIWSVRLEELEHRYRILQSVQKDILNDESITDELENLHLQYCQFSCNGDSQPTQAGKRWSNHTPQAGTIGSYHPRFHFFYYWYWFCRPYSNKGVQI